MGSPMNPAYLAALQRISQPIRADALPPTLDHVRQLLAALGDPQTRYPSVVVAGSVGKGTACHRVAALLGHTHRVGLYTSPHLHLFRERFAVAGRMITQAEFVEAEAAVHAAAAGRRYSTFERATALALWWFAQQAVEVAVLEVGIGGRIDAVNAVPHPLALITPIESEHLAMLGGSLESIAHHKAGVIPPGGMAFTVPQQPQVLSILQQEADAVGAQLQVVADDESLAAAGADFMTRILALGKTRGETAPSDGRWGSSRETLPGRLEVIPMRGERTLILDGAHTPSAAHRILALLDAHQGKPRIIAGMLRDKAVRETLGVFDRVGTHFVLTRAPGDRALDPTTLAERLDACRATVEIRPSLAEALESIAAPEAVVVVTGSLRMVAAARETLGLLSPDALEEAEATRAIFEGETYQRKL